MDLDQYQRVTDNTAVYPEAGTGSAVALSYVALGLTGEAGEVANKVKKILRDNDGEVTPAVRVAVSDELGDVLWYAARLARELGVDLGDVAASNAWKLGGRLERGTIQGSGDDR